MRDWTKEKLRGIYQEKADSMRKFPNIWKGKKPHYLFKKDGYFNNLNCNGADVLRVACLQWSLLNNAYIADKFRMSCDKGNWTVLIGVAGDIYILQWYKDSMKTTLITKNGMLITEDEYIDLLNILDVEYVSRRD